MPLNAGVQERISSLVGSGDVVLFMKGTRAMPQCGFSAQVVQMLDGLLPDYKTVDVLEDPEVRNGIKEYSSWPTIPQLYVKGEFVGGCDIITELYGTGELHQKLGLKAPERKVPKIHMSDSAAQRIGDYVKREPKGELHLGIDARFQPSLGFAPRQPSDIEVQANGVTILVDPITAERADGLSIDVVQTATGASFKIDNPNAPSQVKQLTAADVKKMLDDGAKFEFFDVRTPEERAIAQIPGARLLDEETAAYIEKLPKDQVLVFHCHHGVRSQSAAEHFRSRGFVNAHTMVGGIEAWSLEIDPDVPRY